MRRLKADTSETKTAPRRGATMSTEYADQDQVLTLVDVEDLREWKTGMREESWQFSLAGFFASGALWLGIERLVTEGLGDKLFLMCVVALIFSGTVGFFGLRQLGRRQRKIDRYIIKAETNREVTAGTGK